MRIEQIMILSDLDVPSRCSIGRGRAAWSGKHGEDTGYHVMAV